MPFTTSDYSQFAAQAAANPDVKAKIWAERVSRGARQKNALREMIGPLGSGLPIVENRDLSAGGGDTVVFTSVESERSQGTLGETDLRPRTGRVKPGTMSVQIDILSHAVSWTNKFKLLTKAGKSIQQITADVMTEWLQRKEEDDLQVCALRTCRLLAPTTNLMQVGGGATLAALRSDNTFTTTVIEESKGWMSGIGAKEISIQKEVSGAEATRYLCFAPDRVLRPLRSSTAYLAALQNLDARSKDARLFTGEYGMWDGTVIYPHNIKIDAAAGRQGSPLAPFARLGTSIADGTPTTITGGGGSVDPNYSLGDFFANFPGYLWVFVDGETAPADSGPHYAMIYNVSGANAGKYEIISYTTGNNGNTITGVTRGSATHTGGVAGGGNVAAQAATRFTLEHPAGSLIFPCTSNGVPYGHALVFGDEAIAYAKGQHEAQPIENYEGFQAVGTKDADLKSFGLRSIRGLSAYKNAAGQYNGVMAITAAIKVPGANPVAYNP